jgi:uncharacterized protein (TIGR02145 family)
MVLRFTGLCFLLISCVQIERDNPDDPGSGNYQVVIKSSSSVAVRSSSSFVYAVSSSSSVLTQTGIIEGEPVEYMGETYETVVIGTQTWFKRNLNYAVDSSKCGGTSSPGMIGTSLSDTNTTFCDTYGRLYNWATAMSLPDSCNDNVYCASQINTKHKGICPDGWHIPNNVEWTTLTDFAGGLSTAIKKLKASSGWKNNGDGQDTYGFAALPGGFGDLGWGFVNVGSTGIWWTSSDYFGNYAYRRYMNSSNDPNGIDWYGEDKNRYLSVRCLKNSGENNL